MDTMTVRAMVKRYNRNLFLKISGQTCATQVLHALTYRDAHELLEKRMILF